LFDGKNKNLTAKSTVVTSAHNKQVRALCRLDEIPNGEARGFVVEVGASSQEIFIVRKDKIAFGYLNSCPHAHWPLEFIENQFMTLDKRHIQCVNHGARFEIETGRCLHGPCKGKSLNPFPIKLHKGWIMPAL